MTDGTQHERGAPAHEALLRGIGFWALAASVLNNTIGGGIFAMPGELARDTGAAAPLVLVLGALVFVPIAACFSAAGSRIHATGGAYRYVAAAFGPFAGYLVASLLWISNVTASGAIAAAVVDQLARVVPVVAQPWPRTGCLVGLYVALCALNARGVRIGAGAILVLATTKLLPLLLLAIVGLAYVHPANLHIAALPSVSAVAGSMALVVFAYGGMETALLPSGEVRDPSRTVPRATLAAIAMVVFVYVGLQVVAQGVLGPALPGNKTPLADAASAIAPVLRPVLLATAGISLLGFLQNDLLGTSRLLYALARDGFLPATFANVTPAHRVPLASLLLYAAIALALAIQGGFAALALFSGKSLCYVYLGVCAAAWWLERRDVRDAGEPFRLAGGPLMPFIGCASMLWVLTTTTRGEAIATACAMAVLVAVYAGVRVRRGAAPLA